MEQTVTRADSLQAFTGHRICFVTGHLKYNVYVFMPDALHLRPPVNACNSVLSVH
jgi:hypothetical protein